MSERLLRLTVGAGMFAMLFLSWNPESWPNWLYILWVSLGVLSGMLGEPTIPNLAGLSSLLISLQAVPLLIVFNLFLSIYSSRRLEKLYRILLLILLFVTWYQTFHIDLELPEMGVFGASTAAVSIAALIECIFVARERSRKQETVN